MHQPITVDVLVTDVSVQMEVDTGAALSIMSQEQQEQIFPSAHLRKSNVVLRMHSAEQLKVVGEMPVYVQYGEQKQDLSTYCSGRWTNSVGSQLVGENSFE